VGLIDAWLLQNTAVKIQFDTTTGLLANVLRKATGTNATVQQQLWQYLLRTEHNCLRKTRQERKAPDVVDLVIAAALRRRDLSSLQKHQRCMV
jgi:hypothetical protein